MKIRLTRVIHKSTHESALAINRPDGLILVQFDRLSHPQAFGWHLYPRHHFRFIRFQLSKRYK